MKISQIQHEVTHFLTFPLPINKRQLRHVFFETNGQKDVKLYLQILLTPDQMICCSFTVNIVLKMQNLEKIRLQTDMSLKITIHCLTPMFQLYIFILRKTIIFYGLLRAYKTRQSVWNLSENIQLCLILNILMPLGCHTLHNPPHVTN